MGRCHDQKINVQYVTPNKDRREASPGMHKFEELPVERSGERSHPKETVRSGHTEPIAVHMFLKSGGIIGVRDIQSFQSCWYTFSARSVPPGTNLHITVDDSNHLFASSSEDALHRSSVSTWLVNAKRHSLQTLKTRII